MTSRPQRPRLITPSFSTDQAQAGSDSPSVSTPIPFSTTNPASLLWAHKLQAELGLLFHRMKEVDSKQDAYDARIKATEAAAASLNETRADIVRLKRTKSAIDHGDAETRKWIEMIQVHIQRLDEEIKGDRRRQRNNTVELEQQNDELKGQVSTLGLALKELKETRVHQNKRPSEVSNSNEFKALAQRLDALESQRTQQEKVLRNQVSNLEKAYHASEARYKELEARMNAMVVSPDYPLPTSETTVDHLQPPTPGYVQVPASQEQEPALGQLDNRYSVRCGFQCLWANLLIEIKLVYLSR
jgi:predicted  nucleic acid-binding Zn-ribbon protein